MLRLIGFGSTNREIAQKLYIAEGTVKTHVTHLLNHLSLRNRAQLAIYANSVSGAGVSKSASAQFFAFCTYKLDAYPNGDIASTFLTHPYFGTMQFYTDGWGTYKRHLDPAFHTVGKANTQKIERKHLTLRTTIKRLARKTVRLRLTAEAICFSKSIWMHDTVISTIAMSLASMFELDPQV